MNAERLIELYDRIAEAPDAVIRLRRFVLDLAIRGKLVHQYSSDEKATELLKRIDATKTGFVKTGKLKKIKAVPALQPEQIPFVLPANWAWTQIANLGVVSPRNEARMTRTRHSYR